MSINRRTALRALVAVFALTALVPVPAALASCVEPRPLEQVIAGSEVVIVGTVTALANDGRWASVSVEEVWKGGPLPAIVEVRGGPEPGTASSVDRTFAQGRYLFTLFRDGAILSDNSCSGTTAWVDDLGAFRPADWAGPDQAEADTPSGVDLGFLLPILGVAIVALGVIGGAWMIGRARDA
ncbi:MAG: hypothetical protein AABZ33_00195 [Chloroflexota bacterium]